MHILSPNNSKCELFKALPAWSGAIKAFLLNGFPLKNLGNPNETAFSFKYFSGRLSYINPRFYPRKHLYTFKARSF